MKNNEIDLLIAETLGYCWMTGTGSVITHHFGKYTEKDLNELLSDRGCKFVLGKHGVADPDDTYGLEWVPAYSSDLNAAFKAWSSLSDDNKARFARELRDIVLRDGIASHTIQANDASWIFESYYVNATARQRAEAYLRALNKWKEDEQ